MPKFEMITLDDVKAILNRTISTTDVCVGELKDYPEDIESAYNMLNILMGLLPTEAVATRSILLTDLRTRGLVEVISTLKEFRSVLIANLCVDSHGEITFASKDELLSTVKNSFKPLISHLVSCFNTKDLLLFLNFGRRMRLTCLSDDPTIEGFLIGDDRCNRLVCSEEVEYNPEHWNPCGSKPFLRWEKFLHPKEECHCQPLCDLNKDGFVVDCVRSQFTYVFRNYRRAENSFRLPPGATAELPRSTSYLEKFKFLVQHRQWLAENGMTLRYIDDLEPYDRVPGNTNRLMTVPKDLTRKRLIAPEPLARQVLGYQVSDGMRKCLRSCGVDLTDQEHNRKLCAEASRTGRHVTVDFASASDSVSVWLIPAICGNNRLYEDLLTCRTSFCSCRYKGSPLRFRSGRWSTMGNDTTFDLESGTFLSLLRACVMIDLIFSGQTFATDNLLNLAITKILKKRKFGIFGDDCIVPKRYYETFRDISQLLGFTINESKTFADGYYRESCGVEFFRGIDVSAPSYPRGSNGFTYSTITSLQHKLYDKVNANLFLTNEILEKNPKVTFSEIGSNHDDIWLDGYVRAPERNSTYCDVDHYDSILKEWETVVGPLQCDYCKRVGKGHWHIIALPRYSDSGRHKPLIAYATTARRRSELEEAAIDFCTAKISRTGNPYDRVRRQWIPSRPKRGLHLFCKREGEKVDLTLHSTVVASPGGDVRNLTETDQRLLEILRLYYKLGNGVESTNSSPYTVLERRIVSPASFVYENKTKIAFRSFFD